MMLHVLASGIVNLNWGFLVLPDFIFKFTLERARNPQFNSIQPCFRISLFITHHLHLITQLPCNSAPFFINTRNSIVRNCNNVLIETIPELHISQDLDSTTRKCSSFLKSFRSEDGAVYFFLSWQIIVGQFICIDLNHDKLVCRTKCADQ